MPLQPIWPKDNEIRELPPQPLEVWLCLPYDLNARMQHKVILRQPFHQCKMGGPNSNVVVSMHKWSVGPASPDRFGHFQGVLFYYVCPPGYLLNEVWNKQEKTVKKLKLDEQSKLMKCASINIVRVKILFMFTVFMTPNGTLLFVQIKLDASGCLITFSYYRDCCLHTNNWKSFHQLSNWHVEYIVKVCCAVLEFVPRVPGSRLSVHLPLRLWDGRRVASGAMKSSQRTQRERVEGQWFMPHGWTTGLNSLRVGAIKIK